MAFLEKMSKHCAPMRSNSSLVFIFNFLINNVKIFQIIRHFVVKKVFFEDFLVFVEKEHVGDGAKVEESVGIDFAVHIPAVQVFTFGLAGKVRVFGRRPLTVTPPSERILFIQAESMATVSVSVSVAKELMTEN